MSYQGSSPIDRREALKRMALAASAPAVGSGAVSAATQPSPGEPEPSLTDPNLLKPVVPWKKVLTGEELGTLDALCDAIIPADDRSPSASHAGVPDFINEWVSAPFPDQQEDQLLVRGGLAWLNTESVKRFEKDFSHLTDEQRAAICDDLAYLPKAKPEHQVGARFFAKIRDLCASGFYTSTAGTKDLRYIGNTPLVRFDGPPPSVIKHLGLEDEIGREADAPPK